MMKTNVCRRAPKIPRAIIGEGEGRVRIAGGRLKEVEETEDVRDENEDSKGPDDIQEALTFLPDDVVQKVLQARHRQLEDMLQRSRILLADPARCDGKDNRA